MEENNEMYDRARRHLGDNPLKFAPVHKTPKPIVIIRMADAHFGGSEDQKARRELNNWLNENKSDYHWFVLPLNDPSGESIRFEVFYEKDRQPIDNDGLKKLIEDSLKQKGE